MIGAVIACSGSDAIPDPESLPPPFPQSVAIEMAYSTYWGSGGANLRATVADNSGNVYLAGGTASADWPTTLGPAHQGDTDVTVGKFDADGRLVWARLLGGSSEDYAYVAAVNDVGELYIGGRAGRGFPTTDGAFERSFGGGIGGGPHRPTDGFVTKFSADGEVAWSTYLGGEGDENVRAIHLLPNGQVIVGGGNTTAADLPTDRGRLPGPVLKPSPGGARDAWVAQLAADGGSIDFLTYFGPNDDPGGDETIRGLGVDASGNIWIGGTTLGSDLQTTPDAFQRTRGGPKGTSEAYVAKLSPDGRRLVYFSWLGGSGPDEVETESVSDSEGNFYLAGSTGSEDFPVSAGAFQSELKGRRSNGGFSDGYVAKVTFDGRLAFATLFGGSTVGPEALFGPVVDQAGNVWATGRFRSWDTPITVDALQPRKAGPSDSQDAVLVGFSPDGTTLLYASFLGGSRTDHGRHLAIHPDGTSIYVVGETGSTDFPVAEAWSTNPSGAFLSAFRVVQPGSTDLR